MPGSNCDDCTYNVYDDEYDCYGCSINLDEDEAVRYMEGSFADCPYYQRYDEYKIVEKQN